MIPCPKCGMWMMTDEDRKKFSEIKDKTNVLDSDPNSVLTLEDERWLINRLDIVLSK